MGEAIVRNICMNNHTFYQQGCDSNNGDVRSGNGLLPATLSPNVMVPVPCIRCIGMS